MRSIAALALTALGCACAPRGVASPPAATAARPAARTPALPPWHAQTSGDRPRLKSPRTVITNATAYLGDGRELKDAFIVMEDGRISAMGTGAPPTSADQVVVDARGKYVTPGLIDIHSHLGVYPMPRVRAHSDGNEATGPVTAEVRAVDSFWAQDPGLDRAVLGGVTTIQALPGSANLVGGLGVTLKLRRAVSAQAMRFAGAPAGLKMACGENPKRVYGARKQAPSTRMGNLAGQRAAFAKARRLILEWNRWRKKESKRLQEYDQARNDHAAALRDRQRERARCAQKTERDRRCARLQEQWKAEPLKEPKLEPGDLPPARDPGSEVLAAALEGRVLVHVHCYRADDMSNMLGLADEVGLKIRVFHHALEAYKIRAVLATRRVGIATWADWWGFKLEAYDAIPENLALMQTAGGIPILHSDSAEGIRRLNQEASKAVHAGINSGLRVVAGDALAWITRNAAWGLGIDRYTGTLAQGKDADVVIWDKPPLSVYAKAEHVFIDGLPRVTNYKLAQRGSDFEATHE